MKHSKPKNKKNKILLSYVISMSIILLIPLLFSIFFYTYTLNFTLKKIEDKSYSNITSVKDIIDRDLLYVQKNVFQLVQEPGLVNSTKFDDAKTGPQHLHELTTRLSNEVNSNEFIKYIYIYFHDTDTIISIDGKYNAKDFHKSYVKNLKFSSWQAKLRKTYFNEFMTKEESISIPNTETIEYRQSFPLSGKKSGTLVILLDIGELEKIFVSQGQAPDSTIYVLNRDNDIIFQAGQSYSFINNLDLPENTTIYKYKNFLLCRCVSKETSLQYISVENRNTILKNFHKISISIVCYTIFIILAGIWYIFSASKKAYKPIVKVQTILNSENNEISWSSIHMYLEKLKESKLQADIILAENKNNIKNLFLKKLIEDDCSKEFIEQGCRTHTILLERKNFLVVIASFSFVSEYDVAIIKTAITNIIEDLSKQKSNVYAINSGTHQIAFLFNFDESSYPIDEIISSCHFLNSCIKEEFHHNVLFDFGTIECDIHNINISAQKARESYELRRLHEDSSVVFSAHDSYSDSHSFYTLEQENKLISYVTSGQKDNAISYLDELFIEFSNAKLPILKYFILGISGAAHKLVNLFEEETNQLFTDINLEDIPQLQNLNELKKVLKEIINKTCDELVNKKHYKQHLLSKRMLEYIDIHFSEYDMSLDKVARYFNLSSTYISRFFKEQIHENFSTYLTKLRIGKAKKLLIETSLDINEISTQVGYSATTVFIKNFKKLEQMTPGSYRAKHKAQN